MFVDTGRETLHRSHVSNPVRWRPYHFLAAVPALLMLGGLPFANRVEPFVLGLPFLLFWILLGVVATSAVLGVVYTLDRAEMKRTTKARDE